MTLSLYHKIRIRDISKDFLRIEKLIPIIFFIYTRTGKILDNLKNLNIVTESVSLTLVPRFSGALKYSAFYEQKFLFFYFPEK